MKTLDYTITGEVFARFPGYVRGVVLAYAVTNAPSPDELVALLRDAEASVRQQLKIETLTEHPRIKSWREAFRAFGAKPSEFRSSIEALARRVLRNEPLPTVNALVDIGNLLSLRHLVPTGGHAIDGLTQDICLRAATGNETFTPFGTALVESPLAGEIIFAEGNQVLTRRWVWRQSNHTLLLPTTQSIEFNVDGLPPIPSSEVETICNELIELIQRFCGGRARYELLTQAHPRIGLAE